MPVLRQPETLVQLSSHCICQNIDVICPLEGLDGYNERSDKAKVYTSPFEDIPAALVQLIMENVRMNRRLKSSNVQNFVVSHMQCLHLEKEANPAITLPSVARCTSLRELTLKNQILPHKLLSEVFAAVNNLQKLDLTNSSVPEESLCILGIYAEKLRDLNLFGTNVSNSGIRGLVYGVTFPPSECWVKTMLSKTIKQLDLNGSLVTEDGVRCSLRNMPNLERIKHASLLKVVGNENFADILSMDAEFGRRNSHLNLRSLASDEIDTFLIYPAMKLCPLIRDIKFRYLVRTFRVPEELKKIESLHLSFRWEDEQSFYPGIIEILKKCGQYLRHLTLWNVYETNLEIIASLCSQLEVFKIRSQSFCYETRIQYYVPSLLKVGATFQYLKVLEISNDMNGWSQIPEVSLRHLLYAPLLKRLVIFHQNNLTDDLMIEAAQKSFLSLEYAKFLVCNNITMAAIWMLLRCNNPLSCLELHGCHFITREDYKMIKKYVVDNNIALVVKFSS